MPDGLSKVVLGAAAANGARVVDDEPEADGELLEGQPGEPTGVHVGDDTVEPRPTAAAGSACATAGVRIAAAAIAHAAAPV